MNSFFTARLVLTIRLPAGGLSEGVKSQATLVLGRMKGAYAEFRGALGSEGHSRGTRGTRVRSQYCSLSEKLPLEIRLRAVGGEAVRLACLPVKRSSV
jgi:hypothetical protein